jgi:hypothetical protein
MITAKTLSTVIVQMLQYGLHSVRGRDAQLWLENYSRCRDYVGVDDLVKACFDKFAIDAHNEVEGAKHV